jgi:hypothetical protein
MEAVMRAINGEDICARATGAKDIGEPESTESPMMPVMFLVYLLCKQDANDIPHVHAAQDEEDLIPVTEVALVPAWYNRYGNLVEGTLSQAKKRKSGQMILVIR